MDRIHIVRVRKGESGWEVVVMLGPSESNSVGFLVKIDKVYWQNLTGGICSPERLARITIEFLLHKKRSLYSIDRQIDAQRLVNQFPEYEEEVRKRLVGAFGL